MVITSPSLPVNAAWKSAVFVFRICCSSVCSHLYSDWVWIMLSVLYNLEYCMQNGPYWLCHSAEYKKGSAPAYTDNPLRKQRPAGSSNEYKIPHKSQALAWHPASVLSCLRQWKYAWLWWKNVGGARDVVCACISYSWDRFSLEMHHDFRVSFVFGGCARHWWSEQRRGDDEESDIWNQKGCFTLSALERWATILLLWVF